MNREPQFSLYSEAQCVSERPELAPISGKRVAIIERFRDGSGNWNYTVYDSMKKSSATSSCFETELVPVASLPLVSDRERLEGVVHNTALLRYSVVDQGLRSILQERGIDPMKCLQLSCDQGNDVNIKLMLPDGTIVNADYREDRETRQATRFVEWQAEDY